MYPVTIPLLMCAGIVLGRLLKEKNIAIAVNNLLSGLNDEEIINAATQSNSIDYINSLPEKFDTPLMRIFEKTGIKT